MTRRLFVCHATADVEAASELVDALEHALSFSAGSLWTSSLPGYSADPDDMPALGAALAGSDVVLALVTQTSVQDAQFHFQLGAGWALGAHTVLFVLDAAAQDALPRALSQASIMRGHEPSQWSELVGDLSVRLGLVPRPRASSAPALTPSSPPPAPKSAPPPLPAAHEETPRESESESDETSEPKPASDAAVTQLLASPDEPSAPQAGATSEAPSSAAEDAAGLPSDPAFSAHAEASVPGAAQTHDETTTLALEAAAGDPQASVAPAPADAPRAGSEETPPKLPTKRDDDTPLPAAVAKIANASARTPGASTTAPSASAQPATAAPYKPTGVPPLPNATPQPPARAGVPPLPTTLSASNVIVPPPPADAEAGDALDGEPTTTPKTPIIVLSSVPEPEHECEGEDSATLTEAPRPQPRTAGSYPSVTPHQSYLDELRAIHGDAAERPAPRYSYIDELETIDPDEYAAAASGYEALPLDEDEPETREQLRLPAREQSGATAEDADAADPSSDSDVFARPPTCEMALEAGRAVSDCVFNRAEIEDFTPDLDGPLGSLIECLGASWIELRGEQDLDTWVAVTDHLLHTLPEEVRKLEEWYRVGFELATLHNLAGQLVLDGSDPAAEQHWRGALERFLMRAERAEIGYENLGRVLGLLENLVGPSHERDLSNIPRSLEALRRYAAGADIHTAA